MKIWLVELLGSRELNQLFWVATASSAPFWLMMLLWPRAVATRAVCRLWLAPPLLGVYYLFLLYLAYDITGLPNLKGVEMRHARKFWGHPFLFIALWMHRLSMDLFVGIWIYRFARFRLWEVRLELLLVWLFGPVGALVFAVRYWMAHFFAFLKRREPKDGA